VTGNRLYGRLLCWGVATGASVGGGAGLIIGLLAILGGAPAFAAGSLLYGTIVGTVVALVPSLLGALAVSLIIEWRHPRPADEDAVKQDLCRLFAGVVALLNLILIGTVVLNGDGLKTVASLLAFLVPVNVAVGALLHRAAQSISRGWAS
jgi:hypothetical protein